ncbi:MAG: hypothetical protein NTW21_31860, partial [Verrucomicrobia bacterium]|nr:hypothetical protein [Verrucomicrobiota bacterium]
MMKPMMQVLTVLSFAGAVFPTGVLAAEVSAPGYFGRDGTVDIVSSSHQDTAWMDTPAACRRFRIENNIMAAMEMMRKDPNYTFCMECSLHAMEFLEAHPELRD